MAIFHLGWFTKKGPHKSQEYTVFPSFYPSFDDLWGPFLGCQPKWKTSSFNMTYDIPPIAKDNCQIRQLLCSYTFPYLLCVYIYVCVCVISLLLNVPTIQTIRFLPSAYWLNTIKYQSINQKYFNC